MYRRNFLSLTGVGVALLACPTLALGAEPVAKLSRTEALRRAGMCVAIVYGTSPGSSEEQIFDKALKLMDLPVHELEDLHNEVCNEQA